MIEEQELLERWRTDQFVESNEHNFSVKEMNELHTILTKLEKVRFFCSIDNNVVELVEKLNDVVQDVVDENYEGIEVNKNGIYI